MLLSLDYDISSPQDFLNEICTLILHSDEFKSLSRKQRARYIAIRNDLIECLQEEKDDLVEQCKIYLRLIEYFCDLEDWLRAKMFIVSYVDEHRTVSEQLDILGFYLDKYKIYPNLIDKLDLDFDCFLLGQIASAYAKSGDAETALKYYNDQLIISQNISNYGEQITVCSELSKLYRISNLLYNPKKSLEYAQKSLNLLEKHNIKDYKKHVYALINLGEAYSSLNKHKDAIDNLKKARSIAEQNQDLYLTSHCLTTLGGVYGTIGTMQNLETAIDILSEQKNILKRLEYRRLEAVCLHNLGMFQCYRDSSNNYYKNKESFQEPIENLLESISICKDINAKDLEHMGYGVIGTVYLRGKEYEMSLEYLERIPQGYSGDESSFSTLTNISIAHGCQQNFALAIEYAQKTISLSRETQSKVGESLAIAAIANAHWYQKRYFIGIAYIIKSFLLVPPWTTADFMLIFNVTYIEISNVLKLKLNQFANIFKKYFTFTIELTKPEDSR